METGGNVPRHLLTRPAAMALKHSGGQLVTHNGHARADFAATHIVGRELHLVVTTPLAKGLKEASGLAPLFQCSRLSDCRQYDRETNALSCGSLGVRAENTIVAIGASAGGVTALRSLISRFDAHWPVSVFITLHIGNHRSTLPDILSWDSSFPVQFAEHGKPFSKIIYVAPPDRHLLIGATDTFLSAGPKENHARPAIDPMFRSAAANHGARVIGVLLTGHLQDGMNGLYDVRRHGGRTIVQHPADAEVPEIPINALRLLIPDHLLPVSKIPNAIAQQLETIEDAKLRRRE